MHNYLSQSSLRLTKSVVLLSFSVVIVLFAAFSTALPAFAADPTPLPVPAECANLTGQARDYCIQEYYRQHPPEQIQNTLKCTTWEGKPGLSLAIKINGRNCIALSDVSGALENNPIIVYALAFLNVMAGLVGLTVAGGLIWGGILYTTARADAGQVEKAKTMFINSTIALVLFIFMYAILQFVIPGGIFNG
jgi:hypothetical protein